MGKQPGELDRKEAADFLGYSYGYLSELVDKIPHRRHRGRLFFKLPDLVDFISSQNTIHVPPLDPNSTENQRLTARAVAYAAVASGTLTRGPCEVCGSTEEVEGHHEDYSKPLVVRWLCRSHHVAEHNRVRKVATVTALLNKADASDHGFIRFFLTDRERKLADRLVDGGLLECDKVARRIRYTITVKGHDFLQPQSVEHTPEVAS